MSVGHGCMGHMKLVRAGHATEPGPLTQAQDAVLDACARPTSAVCVLGGPGTGKTTTLVAAVLARVRSGVPLDRLVVLTGSRPAAQQLRTRIVAALGTTQRGLQVTTVHGWCQQLLHRFEVPDDPTPRLLSAPEQEFRVRELLVGWGAGHWPAELAAALGTRGFAREVRAALARARQFGLDPEDLAAAGRAAQRPEWVTLAGFFNEYLDVLDAEGVIDYAELVHRARLALTDERVSDGLPGFAATIFCDEFAELDRGMIHVLADAHRAGSQVVAFVDPDTSVFGFRGADSRAVADFDDRFGPAVTLRLDENLRSGDGVVHALHSVAGRLPHRGVDHPGAVDTGADDAVWVRLVPDSATQTQEVAEVLRQAHLRDGMTWSQLAVITRSGQNSVSTLARRLAAAGVPVQVAGDEVALADELAVRHLLALLIAAARASEGHLPDDRQAARLLRTPIGGLDALGLRRLGRELRRRAMAAAPDETPAASGQLIADEVAGERLVADDEPGASTDTAALVRFRGLFTELTGLVSQRADLPTILWHAWSGTAWPSKLQAEALRGTDNSARANRDLDAVVALFDLASREVSWAGAKGVRSLVAEVEGQQIPADTARENDPRRSGVTLTTLHRSKGRQWRMVVLVGLQEGQWPTFSEPGGLLRADLLAADGLQTPPTLSERLAAERRGLLLAASRASEQLVAIGIDDPSGDTNPPSRFLGELGVVPEHIQQRRVPSTLPALVAELRRAVSDPTAAPALRERAAAQLGWLAGQVDDQGRPIVHGADPGAWWGLREASRAEQPVTDVARPIRLSGSEVEQLLGCPRQWFLSHRARATRSWGVDAAFGTLVHQLVAQAANDGVAASGLLPELDDGWSRLPYGVEWVSLAERQAAQEALERFDVWASTADHRRVLGVEVEFQVPVNVDGRELVLVGTVDRLELDDHDRLRVIDFKTSRTPRSSDEVAEMDQLGIYQLAARLGAFDEIADGRRELAPAEVVYLRCGLACGEPNVRFQQSLDEQPAGQTWVHERLSQAAEIIATEQFEARAHKGCSWCDFRLGCPLRLMGGDK